MKANEFKVMSDCLEKGIDYAFNRFYKYNDFDIPKDKEEALKDLLEDAISLQICEYFNFENDAEN
jgi:hypothetical protein